MSQPNKGAVMTSLRCGVQCRQDGRRARAADATRPSSCRHPPKERTRRMKACRTGSAHARVGRGSDRSDRIEMEVRGCGRVRARVGGSGECAEDEASSAFSSSTVVPSNISR